MADHEADDAASLDDTDERRGRGLLIGIGAVLAVVAIAVVVYLVARDDDGDSTAPAVTTTTTTTSPGTTTAPTTSLPVDTSTAVWPSPSSTTRYADPVSAARGFATDFVGFVDPIVGEFSQGDTQSGEVPVQATPIGPTTTVLVRRLGDSWFVLGSSTPNIRLTSPTAAPRRSLHRCGCRGRARRSRRR